jgi:hypothetical protein
MRVIAANELERVVQRTFPAKAQFSAHADLGLTPSRLPAMAFVHGGPDPFLDRQIDAWLEGAPTYVQLYPLLNRLCRDGALPPGEYAITSGSSH